jgi:hypothetical protein
MEVKDFMYPNTKKIPLEEMPLGSVFKSYEDHYKKTFIKIYSLRKDRLEGADLKTGQVYTFPLKQKVLPVSAEVIITPYSE